MLKDKKLVIFDMDGTLIDSIGMWTEVDKELIKELSGIDVDEETINREKDIQFKKYRYSEDLYLEYYNYLKEKYNMNISKYEVFKKMEQISKKYLKDTIDYKPNAEKVIHYLKENGFILAIATAGSSNILKTYINENKNIIGKANLKDNFSVIYSKDKVEKVKPNPEVFYKIIDELKVKPEECLIVEDSLIGVEAANNAGIEVAVIYDKYSDPDRKEINELSQYQFKDFEDMLNCIKSELEN